MKWVVVLNGIARSVIQKRMEDHQKYVFGLGAMLAGAGLMFVLMHGEVSAENDMTVYDAECYLFKTNFKPVEYCMIKDLTCIISKDTSSCVRGSMFK